MVGLVLPRSAVIAPGCIEEARELIEFLDSLGFTWDNGDDLIEYFESHWDGNDTCFDIYSGNKYVYCCDREYYEGGNFERDYPELFPDELRWFLCSVSDFISMCGAKESENHDFEIASDDDILKFLLV